MNAKPFFVILMFVLFIVIFAGGAIGDANLTRDYVPPSGSDNRLLVGGMAVSRCGASYTVRAGDTMTRISINCNVPLSTLLALNPSITNPNFIRVGQKLALPRAVATAQPTAVPPTAAPTQPPAPEPTKLPQGSANQPAPTAQPLPVSNPTAAPLSSEADVASDMQGALNNLASSANVKKTPGPIPSTAVITGLRPGGSITVNMSGFPAKTEVQLGIGPAGYGPSVTRKETTDEQGRLRAIMPIPKDAQPGMTWVVSVETITEPKMRVDSQTFVIEK